LDLPLFLEQVDDTPKHYEVVPDCTPSHTAQSIRTLLNQYVLTYSDVPESHILTKSILALPQT
jgi:hypothetical protein